MITLPISPGQECWVIFNPRDSTTPTPCKAIAFTSVDEGGYLDIRQVCVLGAGGLCWVDAGRVSFSEEQADLLSAMYLRENVARAFTS